jgi:hypothetical protein
MFASHQTPADTDYDALVLEKLRALYSSCLDEPYLARLGQDPLMRVVRTIRMLFWEKNTLSGTPAEDEEMSAASKIKGDGLTAALAYVHSRGQQLPSMIGWPWLDMLHRHRRAVQFGYRGRCGKRSEHDGAVVCAAVLGPPFQGEESCFLE